MATVKYLLFFPSIESIRKKSEIGKEYMATYSPPDSFYLTFSQKKSEIGKEYMATCFQISWF